MFKLLIAAAATTMLAGCVTTQKASFQPGLGQQAIIRDGRPSIQSRLARSTAVVAPASREAQIGARPTLVVGLFNQSPQPITFQLDSVRAWQVGGQQDGKPLKVYSYEELVQEERGRQVAAALLVGVAAAANSYAASRSSYNPYINTWNQHVAAAENADMIAGTAARGEANLAALEQTIIKDNTIMPGEWYGGVLQINAPAYADAAKPTAYHVAIELGGETHQIDVVQTPIGQ